MVSRNAEINVNKSKTMIINCKEKSNEEKLEILTAYEDLGSIITNDGKVDMDRANSKTILG